MIEMPLYTNDGLLVANARIPPFQIMPEVLVWGDRFFVRRPAEGDEDPRYTEAAGSFFIVPEFNDPQSQVERQIREQRNDQGHGGGA